MTIIENVLAPSNSIPLQMDEDYDEGIELDEVIQGDPGSSSSTNEDFLPRLVEPEIDYPPAPLAYGASSLDIEEQMDDGLDSMIVSFPGVEGFLGNSTFESDDFVRTSEWIRSIEHLLMADLELDLFLEDMLTGDEDENGDEGMVSAIPAENNVVETLALEELKKGDQFETGCCSICQSEVVEGEMLNRLPCCHYFHKDCIMPWLRMKSNCPLCRFELPTKD